jgi:hypothetical protein
MTFSNLTFLSSNETENRYFLIFQRVLKLA